MSGNRRFIIVSNRLPVTVQNNGDHFLVRPSCGGLVSALRPVLRDTSSCWIGWTGGECEPKIADHLLKEPVGPCSLFPVFLTSEEKACFYHGCSNEIIWPLFHDLQSRCNFDPKYWEVYRSVTGKFADAVEQVAHRDDFVWVHDYHLMMLADALSARRLPLKLAYFQHIPFPPPDIFEKLPWRNDILRGLLQFHIVGFQTMRDRQNFVGSLRRCLGDVHVRRLGERLLVQAGSRSTITGVFPISIDFEQFAKQANDSAVSARVCEIRRSIEAGKLILGVDRLDYTKGIPERLTAFRALLRRYPDLCGRITLVQVVVPSREEIPKYGELKLAIERLVSEINGEFGAPGWCPVVYLYRCLSQPDLLSFYRAADVAFVTPLKDGMNLVAKEFCAARFDEQGVLVLSEFAGAATELKHGALLVNPYDTNGVVAALYRALQMSSQEQQQRMRQMRAWLQAHDVFRWCRSFCGQTGAPHMNPRLTSGGVLSFPPPRPRVEAG